MYTWSPDNLESPLQHLHVNWDDPITNGLMVAVSNGSDQAGGNMNKDNGAWTKTAGGIWTQTAYIPSLDTTSWSYIVQLIPATSGLAYGGMSYSYYNTNGDQWGARWQIPSTTTNITSSYGNNGSVVTTLGTLASFSQQQWACIYQPTSAYPSGQIDYYSNLTHYTSGSMVYRQDNRKRFGCNVPIDYMFMWNRALSLNEIAMIKQSPHRIWMPPNARRFLSSISAFINASANFTAQASFAEVANIIVNAGASMNGTGLLSSAGIVITEATFNMLGIGKLTTSSSAVIQTSNTFLGAGRLSTNGDVVVDGNLQLLSLGQMRTNGDIVSFANAQFQAQGLLGAIRISIPLLVVTGTSYIDQFTTSGGIG